MNTILLKNSLAIAALCFILLVFCNKSIAQCPANQIEIDISIISVYPELLKWELYEGDKLHIKSEGDSMLSYNGCVDSSACLSFRIFHVYGQLTSYTIKINSITVISKNNPGSYDIVNLNCTSGENCENAISITEGEYTTPQSHYWYAFKPDSAGTYLISTCFAENDCDTKLWVYKSCQSLVWDNTNIATTFFNDDNAFCDSLAIIYAAMDTAHTYLIRVGGDDCDSIKFNISYFGIIKGCKDPWACNYNPSAVEDDTCYYAGNPNCPLGADLRLSEDELKNSLFLDYVLSDECSIDEECLTGYGLRTIIRFSTKIENIGDDDFYIGNPSDNPSQFSFNNCHGHAHYEGYADYLLVKKNNPSIIGTKNGFCVMDLYCLGGGFPKYSCDNMGLTKNCEDLYDFNLPCQWIDITDVDTGEYILMVKVNANCSPDMRGHYETDYSNNTAQECIRITYNSSGEKIFEVISNCNPYTDCNGVIYGNSIPDCKGVCGGNTIRGDLNEDSIVSTSDVSLYLEKILNESITTNNCNDLSNDSIISVWDAALALNCATNGNCNFPKKILNPYQSVEIGILDYDINERYIDVYVAANSPFVSLKAFEFSITNLKIDSVVNLSEANMSLSYNQNGKIIGLSFDSTFIEDMEPRKELCRIYYSSATGEVCVKNIVHIVNKNHEAIETITTQNCIFSSQTENFTESINIYPNPTDGKIYISTNQTMINLKLTDLMGKTILSDKIYSDEKTLYLGSIANGIYFLHISNDKYVGIQKIIKN